MVSKRLGLELKLQFALDHAAVDVRPLEVAVRAVRLADRGEVLAEVAGRQIVVRDLEIGMVEHVERVPANFECPTLFIQFEVLLDGQVGVEVSRPAQHVAALVAKSGEAREV